MLELVGEARDSSKAEGRGDLAPMLATSRNSGWKGLDRTAGRRPWKTASA